MLLGMRAEIFKLCNDVFDLWGMCLDAVHIKEPNVNRVLTLP